VRFLRFQSPRADIGLTLPYFDFDNAASNHVMSVLNLKTDFISEGITF
jgi:hypothetical protein